jgi:1,4-alpha-glucan branching enzyme
MHDTLKYFAMDPYFRSFHHQLLTFGLMYAYSERFILPLSHDEVVHLKKSLYGKIDGDVWRKRASLRALFGYMWSHPGKKLLFMGGEIGQKTEWNAETSVEWSALPENEGVQRFVRDLNALYKKTSALYELDDDPRGFLWIDANDAGQSVVSFIRFPRSKLKRRRTGRHVVFVANFTPVLRERYRVGVPRRCAYLEVLNSDVVAYGGTNSGNMGRVAVQPVASHGHEQSIELVVPPLGCVLLTPEDEDEPAEADVEAERLAIEADEKAKRAPPGATGAGEGGAGTADV